MLFRRATITTAVEDEAKARTGSGRRARFKISTAWRRPKLKSADLQSYRSRNIRSTVPSSRTSSARAPLALNTAKMPRADSAGVSAFAIWTRHPEYFLIPPTATLRRECTAANFTQNTSQERGILNEESL